MLNQKFKIMADFSVVSTTGSINTTGNASTRLSASLIQNYLFGYFRNEIRRCVHKKYIMT